MKTALVTAAGVVPWLGWWRYRDGIRYPASLTSYAKADGFTYFKCRRSRPVY
ncbi:hypothetical protein MOKP64_12540 [Mycobacterium avium subsp. hominissuis]